MYEKKEIAGGDRYIYLECFKLNLRFWVYGA